MKRISIFLFLVTFLLPVPAVAAEPTVYESALLERINEVRRNPLPVIHRMGFQAYPLCDSLGITIEDLADGFEPLAFDERLYRAAGLHNMEMMDEGYYASVSVEGKSHLRRMLEAGYLPVESGESLGLLKFGNFLDPGEAVDILVDNMVREELTVEAGEKMALNILNPRMADVGISMVSGRLNLDPDSDPVNAYLATCDYGNEDVGGISETLVETVNRYRRGDEIVFSVLSEANGCFPEQMSMARAGWNLREVQWNPMIAGSAEKHLLDMKTNGFFGHLSSVDQKGPFDRIKGFVYEPIRVGELICALSIQEDLGPREAAGFMFEQALVYLDGEVGYPFLLDSQMIDIGLDMGVWNVRTETGEIETIYLLVLDLATDAAVFGGGKGFEAKEEVFLFYPPVGEPQCNR